MSSHVSVRQQFEAIAECSAGIEKAFGLLHGPDMA